MSLRHVQALLRPVGRFTLLASARDLRRPLPALAPAPGVVVRPASPEDLVTLAAIMEPFREAIHDFRSPHPLLEEFQERHRRGHVCLTGLYDGDLAYMGWMEFDEASLRRVGIEVELHPGEAYGYGVFAHPRFRGRGLGTTVGLARLAWLREHGVHRMYGWVNPRNTPILKLQERLGYSHVGSVELVYWRLRRRIPLLNRVVYDDGDPLAQWCGPGRLVFHGGLSVFRRGHIA